MQIIQQPVPSNVVLTELKLIVCRCTYKVVSYRSDELQCVSSVTPVQEYPDLTLLMLQFILVIRYNDNYCRMNLEIVRLDVEFTIGLLLPHPKSRHFVLHI